MNETDQQIEEKAIAFARAHKKSIAHELTNSSLFPSDTLPVAVFMAGSPGAGKTESSQRLIERFSPNGNGILRIDSDELRPKIPGYDGTNSSLFQSATSIIAEKMQDIAIEKRQSYVFDGTLTNEIKARENITRCLNHGYSVFILYVYQDPLQAWRFVKARELRDGRVIPKDAFITQYFKAREVVHKLKSEFGNAVQIDLIVKNVDGTDFRYKANITSIDSYIPEVYTQDTLNQLIV